MSGCRVTIQKRPDIQCIEGFTHLLRSEVPSPEEYENLLHLLLLESVNLVSPLELCLSLLFSGGFMSGSGMLSAELQPPHDTSIVVSASQHLWAVAVRCV